MMALTPEASSQTRRYATAYYQRIPSDEASDLGNPSWARLHNATWRSAPAHGVCRSSRGAVRAIRRQISAKTATNPGEKPDASLSTGCWQVSL